MEPLKTVVFVDGNNFKNNLKAFNFYSDDKTSPYHYRRFFLDEKHFNWRKFFIDGLLAKYTKTSGYDFRLIRVYWYNAASIRPYEPNETLLDEALGQCRAICPWITREAVRKLAAEWYINERGYFEIAREKVYRHIQSEYNFIQFNYVGEYVVKPLEVYKIDVDPEGCFIYQGRKEGEKGVDVGITVDMIAKMPNYDVAILVSGDADFIPVACHLKDNLKYVYQFSIAQGIPPNVTYLSPFLKDLVDIYQHCDELELLGDCLNRYSVPSDILRAIDKRLAGLRSLTSTKPIPTS